MPRVKLQCSYHVKDPNTNLNAAAAAAFVDIPISDSSSIGFGIEMMEYGEGRRIGTCRKSAGELLRVGSKQRYTKTKYST